MWSIAYYHREPMPPSDNPSLSLSKRQHRMLQDMGIDVFFSRQAVSETPAAESAAAAQATVSAGHTAGEPGQSGAKQASPAAAARAALAATTPDSAPAADLTTAPTPPPSTDTTTGNSAEAAIALSFVATPLLVYVGEAPLSELELRFFQDLAGALHRAATGEPLKAKAGNSEFRWPIVETSGTPERAVAVFCDKYRLLSPATAVLGSSGALNTLKQWLADAPDHWQAMDGLAKAASHGDIKRALWHKLLQRMLATG